MEAEVTGPDRRGRPRRRRAREDAGRARRRFAPISSSAPTDGIPSCASGPASTVESLGAPIDVLWMRMSRRAGRSRARRSATSTGGHILVMLDRGDYWQCAFVIPKGGFDDIKRARASRRFARTIASIVPFMRDRVGELRDWDDIKLLTVLVDRLRRWHRPGLLCIGDAAHAMSPIGGVGINLAIQDAVAAANLLAGPLARGTCSDADLARVQKRRELADARRAACAGDRAGAGDWSGAEQEEDRSSFRWPLKLLRWFPMLRRIPARLVGVGVRPEHVSVSRQAQPSRSVV